MADRSRIRAGVLLLAFAALALDTAAAGADYARPRRGREGYAWVTAHSRWGHGVVNGPVREGRHGRLEVRLPGGTWIHCERVCSETLRTESVDYWESHGRDARDGGPNYLQFRRSF